MLGIIETKPNLLLDWHRQRQYERADQHKGRASQSIDLAERYKIETSKLKTPKRIPTTSKPHPTITRSKVKWITEADHERPDDEANDIPHKMVVAAIDIAGATVTGSTITPFQVQTLAHAVPRVSGSSRAVSASVQIDPCRSSVGHCFVITTVVQQSCGNREHTRQDYPRRRGADTIKSSTLTQWSSGLCLKQ